VASLDDINVSVVLLNDNGAEFEASVHGPSPIVALIAWLEFGDPDPIRKLDTRDHWATPGRPLQPGVHTLTYALSAKHHLDSSHDGEVGRLVGTSRNRAGRTQLFQSEMVRLNKPRRDNEPWTFSRLP
jgi:hypothetical protein